jgi:hypothetical protein
LQARSIVNKNIKTIWYVVVANRLGLVLKFPPCVNNAYFVQADAPLPGEFAVPPPDEQEDVDSRDLSSLDNDDGEDVVQPQQYSDDDEGEDLLENAEQYAHFSSNDITLTAVPFGCIK